MFGLGCNISPENSNLKQEIIYESLCLAGKDLRIDFC